MVSLIKAIGFHEFPRHGFVRIQSCRKSTLVLVEPFRPETSHYWNVISLIYERNSFITQTDKLAHWGRDKIDAILQTAFSKAFSEMKMLLFRLKCHWSLLLRAKLTIFQHWFRKWLGAEQANYLNQWWPSSTMHMCVIRPQWVNHILPLCPGHPSSSVYTSWGCYVYIICILIEDLYISYS